MRALVVDQGLDRGSLAAVRALRADGWAVGVGSPRPGLAGSSRAVDRWHFVPAAEDGVGGYLDAVGAAIDTGDYEIVFSADDIGILALSLYRDELDAVVPYGPHETVLRALDKLELTRAAEAVGLRAPRTEEAGETVTHLAGPLIVKARLHSILLPGAPGRLDTSIARTPREANQAIAAIRSAGVEPILQEVVEGELMAFQAVIDRGGKMLGAVQQTSPRTWPPDAGSSARSHTLALDERLADHVAALLRRLGWFGLAQLQFIAPRDGGAPRLIDLNGRFYGSLALAVASGSNLPGIWARLATGRPLRSEGSARPGVEYQWLSRDLRDSWRREGPRGALDALRASTRSVHSVWSRDDPWPAVRHYGSQLAKAGSRRARSLRRRGATRG